MTSGTWNSLREHTWIENLLLTRLIFKVEITLQVFFFSPSLYKTSYVQVHASADNSKVQEQNRKQPQNFEINKLYAHKNNP